MDTKELKLNNLVWDDYCGTMLVSAINDTSVRLRKTLDLPEGLFFAEHIQPIPLTEEWLLKFGFEVTNEGAGFKSLHYWNFLLNDDKLYLRDYYVGGYIWGFNGFIELGTPMAIEYVHQLQNLFFSLTGNELTL